MENSKERAADKAQTAAVKIAKKRIAHHPMTPETEKYIKQLLELIETKNQRIVELSVELSKEKLNTGKLTIDLQVADRRIQQLQVEIDWLRNITGFTGKQDYEKRPLGHL